jgi:hypothetical protein
MVAIQMGEQPAEWWIVLFLLDANGAAHETVGVRRGAEKIAEPVDRIGVGPLQIVEHEDDGRRQSNGLRQRFEETQALPALELTVRDGNVR